MSDETRNPDWFSPRRFAGGLALLLVLAFHGVLFGRDSFYFRDFGVFGYPLAFYHRQSFWRGELPLWNPLNDCGLPFLAQWNTMVLYPGSLIYLLLPLPWSLNLFCLAHLFLGGLGMYYLARRWSGHGLGASVAGLSFALSGLLMSSLKWPNNIAVLGWLPWVLLLVERAWQCGGRAILLAALAGAMQMLAGTPELILLTWAMVVVCWLVDTLGGVSLRAQPGAGGGSPEPQKLTHCAGGSFVSQGTEAKSGSPSLASDASAPEDGRGPARAAARSFGRLAAVVLLIAGLSAAQLLPFFDLLAHSQRGSTYGIGSWAMPWWGWANFLVPLYHCFRSYQGVFAQYDQYWISSYYVSVGVLALALWACLESRGRWVWVLASGTGVCLLLALGNAGGLYAWLLKAFPPLGFMRFPIKFVVPVVVAIPLLAALGLATCENRAGAGKARPGKLLGIGLGLLAAMGVILGAARIWPLPQDDWSATWQNGIGRAAALALALACWYGYQAASRERLKTLLGVALCLVVALDSFTHASWQNPAVPAWAAQPGLAELDPKPQLGQARAMLTPRAHELLDHRLAANPTDDYVASRLGLLGNCNLLEAIPKVDGFYSLYLQDASLVRTLLYRTTNAAYLRLEDFLGVSQTTAAGRAVLWAPRTNAAPLVTAGQRPIFATTAETVRGLAAADFAPQSIVYLPAEARGGLSITNAAVARVVRTDWAAHRVSIEVVADRPSLVVVAQAYYHPWHAYVDGQPAAIWRANLAFQAVAVPAGSHRVRLAYEDRAFTLGMIASLLTLAGCLGLAWVVGFNCSAARTDSKYSFSVTSPSGTIKNESPNSGWPGGGSCGMRRA